MWVFAVAAFLVLALVVYLLLPGSSSSNKTVAVDSGVTPARPAPEKLSEIVIHLPSEIQMFVSPQVFQTRSELDRALARGYGIRLLPSATQTLVFDSIGFAKGYYGYFKVDNMWRRGKLLQTFSRYDTISIDNFLPPLP